MREKEEVEVAVPENIQPRSDYESRLRSQSKYPGVGVPKLIISIRLWALVKNMMVSEKRLPIKTVHAAVHIVGDEG